MKEKMIKNRIGVLALSLVMILCMMLSPMTAFADTSTIPMYLTVKEEPLVFDVTERITMEATQGTTDLSVTPVTVTNNGKKIQVSSIAINPASGWTVEANSTDFSTAGKKSLGFTCNSHDFSTGAYAPGDQIDTGSNLMYTLSGKVSAKADVMASTQVASMVVTIESAKEPLKIVSWADGTDEEIVAMVAALDAGEITVADTGWSVGDTRTVHLSAMEATNVGETHAEQDVELVLMHQGGYELADGSTCNFVVGQKDCLNDTGYMNSTNTNSSSWEGSARRAWCNDEYKNAMPASLSPIFKQFKTITAETYNGDTLQTSLDYFALPAAKEVFGGETAAEAGSATAYSNLTEFNALFQFDWYKTADNRIKNSFDQKLLGIVADYWWERSPVYYYSGSFCSVSSDGGAGDGSAGGTRGLAPFGCI